MLVRRRPGLTLIALVLLVCSAAVAAQGFLPHTDDGCDVEVHCLVCRHALGAHATLAAGAPAPALFAFVVAPAVPQPARAIARPRPALPARAPPVLDQA